MYTILLFLQKLMWDYSKRTKTFQLKVQRQPCVHVLENWNNLASWHQKQCWKVDVSLVIENTSVVFGQLFQILFRYNPQSPQFKTKFVPWDFPSQTFRELNTSPFHTSNCRNCYPVCITRLEWTEFLIDEENGSLGCFPSA